VISPRSRPPLPSPLEFYFRDASRMALLGLCVSVCVSLCVSLCVSTPLCFGGSALSAGKFPSGEPQRQPPYALIFGTVWGPNDRPVYGVKIKIRRESEKKARWEQYSNHSGEFAQRVPAGKQDYVVWADLKGLKSTNGRPLQGEEVRVHVDGDERVDTGLHLK
jgi:hypothetical protein